MRKQETKKACAARKLALFCAYWIPAFAGMTAFVNSLYSSPTLRSVYASPAIISAILGGRPRKSSVAAEINLPVRAPLSSEASHTASSAHSSMDAPPPDVTPQPELVDEVRARLGGFLGHLIPHTCMN